MSLYETHVIEELLKTHPDIDDVLIIPIPDPTFGEEFMAWIVPSENKPITEDDVREFYKGKMSKHKLPRYIEFIDEFPRTASGKIQKSQLKDKAKVRLNLKN